MSVNEEMRDQIMAKASTNVLRKIAKNNGMRSLRQCGLLALFEGQTTIDEVMRETLAEDD